VVSNIIVAAVAQNGVIGSDGDMPWRLPTDLKRFKAATLGKPVIMGRKTLEAIGKPLPGRENIIVSRQDGLLIEGVHVVASLQEALKHAQVRAPVLDTDEIIIAGGGEIYRQSMPLADILLITRVIATPQGDAHFPEIDDAVWEMTKDEAIETGPKDSAGLRQEIYRRRSSVS